MVKLLHIDADPVVQIKKYINCEETLFLTTVSVMKVDTKGVFLTSSVKSFDLLAIIYDVIYQNKLSTLFQTSIASFIVGYSSIS